MTGAFKSQPDTIVVPPQWWPKAPTVENFKALIIQNPALKWLWNSIYISVVTMLLVCGTSSLAGYALAKKRFYGQDRKSTRLNSSHANISYAVFCLKKKNNIHLKI